MLRSVVLESLDDVGMAVSPEDELYDVLVGVPALGQSLTRCLDPEIDVVAMAISAVDEPE